MTRSQARATSRSCSCSATLACAARSSRTWRGLRDALRRRDVYVAPSERYADERASLLGDAAWAASREHLVSSRRPAVGSG